MSDLNYEDQERIISNLKDQITQQNRIIEKLKMNIDESIESIETPLLNTIKSDVNQVSILFASMGIDMIMAIIFSIILLFVILL